MGYIRYSRLHAPLLYGRRGVVEKAGGFLPLEGEDLA
jgi:hypothetical protein